VPGERTQLYWQMPTELPPRHQPPKSLWPIFLDAAIAIAAAVMITEVIASVRWAFS
jgi:hypothetical protein